MSRNFYRKPKYDVDLNDRFRTPINERPLKVLPNGNVLGFERGKIDDYCVYIVSDDGGRDIWKDAEYFQTIHYFADKYGREKFYEAFMKIFRHTTFLIDRKYLREGIDAIVEEFGTSSAEDKLLLNKLLSWLYLGMIAEERKDNSLLGKYIKRLGIYRLLYSEDGADKAANYMRGGKWTKLREECESYGFGPIELVPQRNARVRKKLEEARRAQGMPPYGARAAV